MGGLVERLRDPWKAEGIAVRAGVSLDEIRSFDSASEVVLPADFKDYLLTVDGMVRWQTDEDLLEFLHLGAIKSVPQELAEFRGIPEYGNIVNTLRDAERHFVIADFMLSSHVYSIRLSDDPEKETPIFFIGGSDHHYRVVGSFTEFAEVYLRGGEFALI